MAVKKKAKKTISSTAATKAVDTAKASLEEVATTSSSAILTLGKESKKLTIAARRLSKKRAVLMRKKKTAANKLKTDPNAANRKNVKLIENELAAVKKEATKVAGQKATLTPEMSALRAISRQTSAYTRALGQVDKVLNKPKKKRRRKKAVKKVAEAQT
ncbi:hypothetical protein MNBD_GAMMA24-2775 [hydrothermal vent metagenome]|uniref:Uncharacterized protein n=1 Tax=hydrothermal vent metagenome TaxID=652676 RepID=A0A3B1B4S2_9ZZZZ